MELAIVAALIGTLLIFVLMVLCGILVWQLLRNRKAAAQAYASYESIYNSYKDLIDRDSEIAKRDQALADLRNARAKLEADFAQRSQSLNSEYSHATSAYEALNREVAELEETLDLQSYGIYKPHYDFATSEEYKTHLETVREKQKRLITAGRAAICTTPWSINGSLKEGEKQTKQYSKLMLRAFNGECDAAMTKVRWNNISVMEDRIQRAFDAINKMGLVQVIYITDEYMGLKMDELRLAHEYQEKVNQEKEEQRRIQEQIREEEKAQREIERAQQDAQEEEDRYQKALDRARAEMEKATGTAVAGLNQKVQALEEQLRVAQELKARAISRAQITKSGYVYVISNIGSFGENVYKIGMTRRLEPMDRVRELGDASVPFEFDVHAMIYSDNAPELEYQLQQNFKYRQINLVNDRKEFFNVSIADIEDYAKKHGLKATITQLAEAREYRESAALRSQSANTAIGGIAKAVPSTIVSVN